MKRNTKNGVFAAVRSAAAAHRLLSSGTVLCAAASVLASLLPQLLLARVHGGDQLRLPGRELPAHGLPERRDQIALLQMPFSSFAARGRAFFR